MKTCPKCTFPKDEGEFGKNKSRQDGLASWCKGCNNSYATNRWRQNPGAARSVQTKYRESHLAQERERHRKYRAEHADWYRAYCRNYERDRKAVDPEFKLVRNLRTRLYYALMGGWKSGSAVQDLGCTIPELRSHLEARFYSHPITGEAMSWVNYGSWHIDHRRPLDSFDLADRQQALEACHYTNLQPLWAEHNLAKSNRIDWTLARAEAS